MTSETSDISDGYHTFGELYDHRRALTAALAASLVAYAPFGLTAWRSRAHHPDNSPMYDGYFIVGIELPTGIVTYHYDLKHWADFDSIATTDHAPKWDGATPADSVTRLLAYARS